MKQADSRDELEYNALSKSEEQREFTPRPRFQIVLAWILISVVVLAILGTCYWQIFGAF